MKTNNIIFKIRQIFTEGPVREGSRNPFVDWIMILTLSSIVALILIGNGVYLFERVSSGDIQSKEMTTPAAAEVFSVKDLDFVIDKFNTKSESNLNLKKSYQTVQDPSI